MLANAVAEGSRTVAVALGEGGGGGGGFFWFGWLRGLNIFLCFVGRAEKIRPKKKKNL